MKLGDIVKLLGVLVGIVAAVFAAVVYFTPRAETREIEKCANEKIKEVEMFAGRTQKQLDVFQIDLVIKENKRQLRQIEIEEVRPGVTRRMREIFMRQKRDILDELEMLEHKKELIKAGGE